MNQTVNEAQTAQKTLLCDYIRARLEGEYTSIREAADRIDIPYERLKKTLQRNRFSDDDLSVLFPDVTIERIREKYEFKSARKYYIDPARRAVTLVSKDFGRCLRFNGVVTDQDVSLILENKVVLRRIAERIHQECEEIRKVLC